MAHASLAPVDTRALFRPVSSALATLLRRLDAPDFDRPTVAGSWLVRDVVAHLIDLTLRRLSFHRDRMPPPPPSRPIASERDFAAFINGLNAEWVGASRRFSPRVLTDLFDNASRDLAAWFESLPPDAPGLFGVSWAGEMTSDGWFDVAREFTELWHHQEQIRLAVGAPSLDDARYLRAVVATSLRALPHSFRDVPADEGTAVVMAISGPAGGTWTLSRHGTTWRLADGEAPQPTTRVSMDDQTAWRLLYNALKPGEATSVRIDGRRDLGERVLATRSIVI